MSRKIFTAACLYVAVLILAFLATFVFPKHAQAGTLLGNEEGCVTMAQDVQYAADMRDSGWPWEVGTTLVEQFVAASLADPGATYVKDEDDAEFFRYVMKYVWKNKDMTPQQLTTGFYKYCMQHGT